MHSPLTPLSPGKFKVAAAAKKKKAAPKKAVPKKAAPKKAAPKKAAPKKAAAKKKSGKARAVSQPPPPFSASSLRQRSNHAGVIVALSGLENKGQIYSAGGETYDADLALKDVACNSNKFYQVQIVKKNAGGFAFIQHWGRIGAKGQCKVDNFSDAAGAIKALEKKFKTKAGIKFSDRNSAAAVGGKYSISAKELKALDLAVGKCPSSYDWMRFPDDPQSLDCCGTRSRRTDGTCGKCSKAVNKSNKGFRCKGGSHFCCEKCIN